MADREKAARAVEAALCKDAGRTIGAIWSNPRGRAQMLLCADAALSATQGDGWRGIEPVAWRYTYPDGADRLLPYRSDRYTAARGWTETPLYALPTLPSAPGDEGESA